MRPLLDLLNERPTRDYDMSFDSEAMIQSDLTDPHKFHPPHGRFYLAK